VKTTANGPLILASTKLADELSAGVPASRKELVDFMAKWVAKSKGVPRASADTTGDLLFFPSGASRCAFHGDVLVRVFGDAEPTAELVAKVKTWKETGAGFKPKTVGYALFNPGGERLDVKLAKGDHDVSMASVTSGGAKVSLVRFAPRPAKKK
jgi:hypothetical protein